MNKPLRAASHSQQNIVTVVCTTPSAYELHYRFTVDSTDRAVVAAAVRKRIDVVEWYTGVQQAAPGSLYLSVYGTPLPDAATTPFKTINKRKGDQQ